MSFESFDPQKEEKSQSQRRERLAYIRNNQEKILDNLFSESDERIGKGSSAEVKIDPQQPDLCYKEIYRGYGVRDPEEESDFLREVSRFNSKKVRAPEPYYVFEHTVSQEDKAEDETRKRIPVLAMERVDGKDLEQIRDNPKYLEEIGITTLEDANELRDSFRAVEEFVAAFNEDLGIYHEDLREPNIMLDRERNWAVIDFGRASKDSFRQGENLIDRQKLKSTRDTFMAVVFNHVKNLQK